MTYQNDYTRNLSNLATNDPKSSNQGTMNWICKNEFASTALSLCYDSSDVKELASSLVLIQLVVAWMDDST